MGSKGGSIFGAIANQEKEARQVISPIAKVLDPIGNFVVNKTNDFTNKPWLEQREKLKQGQQQAVAPGTKATPSEGDNSLSNSRKSASGSAQGPGAVATTMVTNPPDTEEGNKLRLSQSSMLG